MERFMQKMLLAVAAAAIVAAALAPSQASARHRKLVWTVPAEEYCGGRLPAYGYDACGFREFSYGDGCWKRVIVRTPDGPQPRRVRTCGRVVD